jgi:hypothetical protein
MNKIVTSCQYPPIPDRRFDWIAYIDGDEESGNYGYGPTEEAAIADWVESYAEEYEERDAAQREREADARHNGGLSPLGEAIAKALGADERAVA